jgi:hypothetical protein
VDQGWVTADRGGGTDLEVGPAEFVLDLLVALLDPVPDPVKPHDFGQVGRLVRRACSVVRAAGPGRLVARCQVALSGSVCGSVVAMTRRV